MEGGLAPDAQGRPRTARGERTERGGDGGPVEHTRRRLDLGPVRRKPDGHRMLGAGRGKTLGNHGACKRDPEAGPRNLGSRRGKGLGEYTDDRKEH